MAGHERDTREAEEATEEADVANGEGDPRDVARRVRTDVAPDDHSTEITVNDTERRYGHDESPA